MEPKRYVLICDIDNCFVDSRQWFKEVPPANNDRAGWDEYQKHDDLCKPNKPVIDLVCATADILPVFFLTGREDRKQNRANTMKQIKDFSDGKIDLSDKVKGHFLFMRTEFDYRPSDVVKEEMLRLMVGAGCIPVVAIDDEEANCAMYKRYNIPTVLYDIDTNTFNKYHGVSNIDIPSGGE